MSAGKTIGVIIARMSSSRLPGKVLRHIQGKPMLNLILERLRATPGLEEIWLASTRHPSDEPLLLWGIQEGLQVLAFPGETDDVVGRLTAVVNKSETNRFVAVLGDSPFPDPRLLTNMLSALDANPDWEAVAVDKSKGQTVHRGILCYTAQAWQKIDQASQQPKHREHLASILQEQPNLITKGLIEEEALYYDNGAFRLTVDTQADFNLVTHLVETLGTPGQVLPLETIVKYLHDHPEIAEMNNHVRQKTVDDEPLKILIAAQAGGDYGTGHLARCRTLGRTLEEHFSAGVTYWLDGPSAPYKRELNEEGCNVIEGNWSLAETLRQGKYNRVVIDFQDSVTPSLIESIRMANPDISIIVVDNNGLGCGEVDAVIFPNIHAIPSPDWQGRQENLFQGAQYTVLGSGFMFVSETPEAKPLDVPCILVTMGGRDPELITEKILDAIKDLRDCHIDMIVPPLYPYPENLEKIATMLPSTITLHWRIDNLRPLMQRATLAIAAFGITAYELAAIGVPSLMYSHYSTHLDDLERFCSAGSAINLGWGANLDPRELFSQVSLLLQNTEKRTEMSNLGKAMVDMKGPVRVAEIVVTTNRKPASITQDS